MSRANGKWFRFYEDALDDQKVQRLPEKLFKTYVNLLCLASRFGGIFPPLLDITFVLRLDASEAAKRMRQLEQDGLIDRESIGDETILTPHNWSSRQFDSDSSTKRVREFRKRKEAANETADVTEVKRFKVVSGNGFDSVSVSESESVGSSLSGKKESRGLDSQDHELNHSWGEP